ncbi:MAG: dNTP triphosphohydrolase [Porphyromonadaceae bacterium]|nr:dNTP triphosphohydrolase [Porphyromonadaceae bacterium]
MQWEALLSPKRLGSTDRQPQTRGLARSDFERDYDRMIFSPPFRRLQNKTQVFPLPGNIFVHNRLTHSLEVSCLGRSLGNIVAETLEERHPESQAPFRAISSIVSAACLAHDMGNPPFGHSGERAIGAYFSEGNGTQWREAVEREGGRWSDFLQFEGNANAFRLLTHQFKGRRPGGFALTYSTLASIIKYPYSSQHTEAKGKFGFFQTEEDTMREVAQELGLLKLGSAPLHYVRYPLVYLVEAADDICYQIMDIEDAYKLGIVAYPEAVELLSGFFSSLERDKLIERMKSVSDPNEQIGYLRSKAINLLVEETASIFLDHEQDILRGNFSGSLTGQLSSTTRSAYRDCSSVAWQRIYCAKEVLDVELAGHRIFRELLDKLLEALHHPNNVYSRALLGRISTQYDTEQTTTYGKIQCALDYLSGMTDIYALDLYRRITGMNLPAV